MNERKSPQISKTILSIHANFYHYFTSSDFFTPALADIFDLSFRDYEFPPVSRTLLSILADLDTAAFRMVSIFPPIPLCFSSISDL